MARRTSTHTPTPPRTSTPTATVNLAEAVDAVLGAWAIGDLHSEQTLTRMSETIHRFYARLIATGVGHLAQIDQLSVEGFVHAPTRTGEAAALATMHARRTAVRTFFRTARALQLTDRDPTMDLWLLPRGATAARALSDDEVTLCRASAQVSPGHSAGLRAAAWPLGETGAVSSEITEVRIIDINTDVVPARVRLPGTRRHDPRTATSTRWASTVLAARVTALRAGGGDDQVLVAYGGHRPPGGAKAQAAVCMALRGVIDSAGLGSEPDVRPASLRNWVGRSLYDAGHPIEAVARALGARSLDGAAQDIGLRWREVTP